MRTLSTILGAGHLAFGAAFAFLPAVGRPDQVSVVAFLNPVWPWAFAISGGYLLYTATRWEGVAYAHVIAAAVFAGLTSAAAVGGISTLLNDQTPINPGLGIAAALLTAVHLVMSRRTPKGRSR